MDTTDITTTILQNLRNDVARVEAKLDDKVAKLDDKVDELRNELKYYATREQLNSAVSLLDQRIDRLYMKVVENDVRQQNMQRTLDRMMYILEAKSTLEGRVDRCELDIVDLKQRVL